MFITICLLAVIGYVVWLLLDDGKDPLDKLPGPPRKPIVGCVFELLNITPREMFVMTRQFAKQYGDRYVIKIMKRRILHINSVKDVEVVLSHSENIQKSRPYTFLEAWLGTGLLLSTETAMGTQLDADKSAATLQYKGAIKEIGSLLVTRLNKFWLHNEFLFRKSPIGREFEKYLHEVHSFADNVIKERKEAWKPGKGDFSEDTNIGTKKRLAMLDLLLDAENKGEIDLDGIREEVNTFMFEGHDTTAIAITLGLMLIADHEDVQDRIYEECQTILGNSDRSLTMTDLAAMKYLEGVIKETLRLYPSVPFIGRKITEDFMLDNILVKKGTDVAVHIYDLNRRPDLYPNPEEFRPERFLNGEVVHPYAFVPFRAGPRNCIGQRFAMLEIKFMLCGICRNFKLYPRVKGARPELLADMLIRPADSIHVKFVRR